MQGEWPIQQEAGQDAATLSWYEREGGKYLQKRGVDKYPAGTYGFVDGLYVRLSREDRSASAPAAKTAEGKDLVDLTSEDSFPASDPPSH